MSVFNNFLETVKGKIIGKNKKPLPKSERYYEDEPEDKLQSHLKFSLFIAIAVIVVLGAITVIFAVNHSNNAFVMFNKASTNNFECGSFSYDVSVGINDETYMKYDGSMEFDLNKQAMKSSYYAMYNDYSYDAVVFGEGVESYRGNFYGGKWSVDDYSEKALDFYDFYRDYRKGNFDAGAMMRFTNTNDTFNAPQLERAFEDIMKELSKGKNMRSVMHQEIVVDDESTTVKFTPDLEEVFYLITSKIGAAFSSADDYSNFKESVELSTNNLANANMVVTYSISGDGYLTQCSLDYKIGDKSYFIDANFSDFGEAKVDIPDDFFTAADIEK